jgi:hypothetical protein
LRADYERPPLDAVYAIATAQATSQPELARRVAGGALTRPGSPRHLPMPAGVAVPTRGQLRSPTGLLMIIW